MIYSPDVAADIHGQFKMTAQLQDGCQNKGF